MPSYNNESLNANANVRNTFSENIYTPGVSFWELKGGVLWEIFGRVDLSVYAGGVSCRAKWGSGTGGGTGMPMFKRSPALLVSRRVNALRLRLAR